MEIALGAYLVAAIGESEEPTPQCGPRAEPIRSCHSHAAIPDSAAQITRVKAAVFHHQRPPDLAESDLLGQVSSDVPKGPLDQNLEFGDSTRPRHINLAVWKPNGFG